MERYRTAIRLVARIAAICLPLGPILFALKLTDDVVTAGGYLGVALAPYRLTNVFLGCLKVSALALPTVAILSFGMYLLGKLRRDTFLIAVGVGTILVCIGIGITTFVMIGLPPGIVFSDETDRYAAAMVAAIVLAVSALLSALYWLFAVRRDRSRRLLVESGAQAIRAME